MAGYACGTTLESQIFDLRQPGPKDYNGVDDKEQVIREYTLRSVSDDYENIERIFADVTCWAADRGLKPDRDAILAALQKLVEEDYVQAYRFELPFRQAIPTIYSTELVDDLWFYLTPKGEELASGYQQGWL